MLGLLILIGYVSSWAVFVDRLFDKELEKLG
jgi:hypothetical protein